MHVLTEANINHFETTMTSLAEMASTTNMKALAPKVNGELRMLILVYRSSMNLTPPKQLIVILNQLLAKVKTLQKTVDEPGTSRKWRSVSAVD